MNDAVSGPKLNDVSSVLSDRTDRKCPNDERVNKTPDLTSQPEKYPMELCLLIRLVHNPPSSLSPAVTHLSRSYGSTTRKKMARQSQKS